MLWILAWLVKLTLLVGGTWSLLRFLEITDLDTHASEAWLREYERGLGRHEQDQ
jgi:hypothetical protein